MSLVDHNLSVIISTNVTRLTSSARSQKVLPVPTPRYLIASDTVLRFNSLSLSYVIGKTLRSDAWSNFRLVFSAVKTSHCRRCVVSLSLLLGRLEKGRLTLEHHTSMLLYSRIYWALRLDSQPHTKLIFSFASCIRVPSSVRLQTPCGSKCIAECTRIRNHSRTAQFWFVFTFYWKIFRCKPSNRSSWNTTWLRI